MGEKQTRRRGPVLEQAILDAAWQELADHGWAGFTVEGVAARSGAAKTVIYRRWSNRVHLAQDMLQRATIAARAPFSSTGSLRTDLLRFLEDMSAFLRTPFGDAARGVICGGDQAAQRSILGDEVIVAEVGAIVEQACARGELTRRPSAFAANLGHAVVMAEFLHTGSPPTPAGIAEIVDTAWLPALRGPHKDLGLGVPCVQRGVGQRRSPAVAMVTPCDADRCGTSDPGGGPDPVLAKPKPQHFSSSAAPQQHDA